MTLYKIFGIKAQMSEKSNQYVWRKQDSRLLIAIIKMLQGMHTIICMKAEPFFLTELKPVC